MENHSNDIIQKVKKFSNHIAYINDLFELQREIQSIEDNNSCPNAMRLIVSALYDCSFMALSRLIVDKRSDSASIISFLKEISSTSLPTDVSDQIINKAKSTAEIFRERSALLDKIKKRRNKLIAHNDNKYFLQEENYCDRIYNHELWELSAVIKEFLDLMINKLEIDASTEGRYITSHDFMKIIDSKVFRVIG